MSVSTSRGWGARPFVPSLTTLRAYALPALVSATLGMGAGLLFLVEPMIARMVLPQLGGSPSVWNTCMVFFQAALLAGYAYAHAISGMRRPIVLHAAILAAPLAFLPIAFAPDAAKGLGAGSDLTFWLLGLLIVTAGVPFFAVATTTPVLQGWFARSGHASAADPYFLYGASNLGSLAALVAYPTLVEPNLGLAAQSRLWAAGYALLAISTISCAFTLRPSAMGKIAREEDAEPLKLLRWARWAGLAALPSSLMLGVTTYLSTDIAPVPLLWVVPMAIYLLTYVLAFARRPPLSPGLVGRLLPIAVALLTLAMSFGGAAPAMISLHLLTFFLAAMACHGELARLRPPSRHLTAFFLAMSVGGVLGGAFNAIAAPLIFDRLAEYPLAIALACLVLPWPGSGGRRLLDLALLPTAIAVFTLGMTVAIEASTRGAASGVAWKLVYGAAALACLALGRRPVAFALAIGAVLLAGGLAEGPSARVEHRERGFFGVLKVVRTDGGEARSLVHGATLHGRQDLRPGHRREPLLYYHREGPVAQAFEALPGKAAVAIVGLGAGSLACYARAGERWTFYEIDPAVVRIAQDPAFFTFLRDCEAGSPRVVLGDARLRLREAPDGAYDLVVLDAFSSDAVPAHLLTREAWQLYRRKLATGGRIAVHLSNRYLDLVPVVAASALAEGMACRVRSDPASEPERRSRGVEPTTWAVLARGPADLGPLADDSRWMIPEVTPGDRPWSDDWTDLARHFKFRGE